MTTKKMVKLKGMIASLVLISLSAGILQSCNKLEESSLPEATHNADLAALESSSFESGEVMEGSLTRRPNQDITNPSWTPGNYDPIVAFNYQISSPQKIKGDTYRFVVTSTNFARKHIYIKYYSPQGNEVFEEMRPNLSYSSFEIQRRFQQEGIYHIRFYVESTGSVLPYPSIHKESYKINVELPVNVPPIGDDYEQKVRRGGSDVDGTYDISYFYYHQCTSWVGLKVNQMWNTRNAFNNRMFGSRLGDAEYWKTHFERNGYRVDRNPKPGCIIWFPPNQEKWDTDKGERVVYSTKLGHVGFVHTVTGNSVIWTEYHGGRKGSYTEQNRTLNALPSSARFIHVQKRIH